MNDQERAERVRELRGMLDAQAARDAALLAELRSLTASGSDQINDQIRAATGRGRAAATGGPQSINQAIRRAAGRPTSEGDDHETV